MFLKFCVHLARYTQNFENDKSKRKFLPVFVALYLELIAQTVPKARAK